MDHSTTILEQLPILAIQTLALAQLRDPGFAMARWQRTIIACIDIERAPYQGGNRSSARTKVRHATYGQRLA
jgi:hypothetical protein